jgi:hypothetical protein
VISVAALRRAAAGTSSTTAPNTITQAELQAVFSDLDAASRRVLGFRRLAAGWRDR